MAAPKSLSDITALTGNLSKEYWDSLIAAKSWEEAKTVLTDWAFLTPDAMASLKAHSSKYQWVALVDLMTKMPMQKDLAKTLADIRSIFSPEVLSTVQTRTKDTVTWGASFLDAVKRETIRIIDGVAYTQSTLPK